MPTVTIFNRLNQTISYKMNVNATNVGPGRIIAGGGSDGPHGDYAKGTTLTVWWRRGDTEVKTCDGPGCNGTRFQMNSTDIGVLLGEDPNFKEQEAGV